MTGGGGWPMSVWLTPELKPFVGATYFPPEDRAGQPGFKTILNHISKQVTQLVLIYFFRYDPLNLALALALEPEYSVY